MSETKRYIQLLECLSVEGADPEGYRPAFAAAIAALRACEKIRARCITAQAFGIELADELLELLP